jgi:hypothetical protein
LKRSILLAAVCLAASAFAAPPNVQPGFKKVKAAFAPLEGGLPPLELQFNPKEIPVDKQVPWQKHKNSEGDDPTLEFTAAEPKTMTLELLFDTFEERSSVYFKYIQSLERFTLVDQDLKRPPLVTFTWGDSFPVFKGVIESLSVKYTLFLPDGTPVRATATVRMRQASKLLNRTEAEDSSAGACSSDTDCSNGQRCQNNLCVAPK